MGIGSRIAYNDTKLEPNMVLSNEPGYYQDGEFGIRIESLVVVKQEKTVHEFGGVKYYGMEHLTMVSSLPGAAFLRFATLRGGRGPESRNAFYWSSQTVAFNLTKKSPLTTSHSSSSARSRPTSSTLRSCRSTNSSGSTSTMPKSETRLDLCCARRETTRRSSTSRSVSQFAFSLILSCPHPRSLSLLADG